MRRLTSTSQCLGPSVRNEIVKQFIQLVVNSGHKFQYVKSVVLQAISKYIHMLERASLPEGNKNYSPLHRPRAFKDTRRKLIKYTGQATWYTNLIRKDPGGQGWKRWIVRKYQRRMMMEGRKHGKGEALGRLNKRSRGKPLSNYQSHYYLNKRTRGNYLSNYESNSQQMERPRGNPLSNYKTPC